MNKFLLLIILFLFLGCKNNSAQVINENNTQYINEDDTQYTKCINEADILYPKRKYHNNDTCWMYADRFGSVVLPDARNYYRIANPFSCGLALVLDRDKKWKYIDKKGKVIIDASEYSMCWGFEEPIGPHAGGFKGLAYVSNWGETDEKFGFIDLNGRIALPVDYDAILGAGDAYYPEYDKILLIKKNGLYGAINEKTDIIIPIQYDEMSVFIHGSALAKRKAHWGLINTKGETILPFTILEIGQQCGNPITSEMRYLVKKDKYWGIIDQKGKDIIPFIYTQWERYPDSDTIRLHKEDGSNITWKIREDKLVTEYSEYTVK